MSNHSRRWAAAVQRSDKPAYLAIADAIAEDIQTGQLVANQKLPTLRKLAVELDLNFTTVARGYAEAQRRGLIDAQPGRGTVVKELISSQPVRRARSGSLIDMTMNMPPEPQDRALLQRLRQGFAGIADLDPFELLRYARPARCGWRRGCRTWGRSGCWSARACSRRCWRCSRYWRGRAMPSPARP